MPWPCPPRNPPRGHSWQKGFLPFLSEHTLCNHQLLHPSLVCLFCFLSFSLQSCIASSSAVLSLVSWLLLCCSQLTFLTHFQTHSNKLADYSLHILPPNGDPLFTHCPVLHLSPSCVSCLANTGRYAPRQCDCLWGELDHWWWRCWWWCSCHNFWLPHLYFKVKH